MPKIIELKRREAFEVRYLRAVCGVRYWEDAKVNGVVDTDGTLIPHRVGNDWRVVIDLDTGRILDWPEGTTASIHYKVCDDGTYTLLDEDMNAVTEIEGYVPTILFPTENGYGDYVIIDVGPDGVIAGWCGDELREFQ